MNDAVSKAMFVHKYKDTVFDLHMLITILSILERMRLDGFKEGKVVRPFLEHVLWKELRMRNLPFF